MFFAGYSLVRQFGEYSIWEPIPFINQKRRLYELFLTTNSNIDDHGENLLILVHAFVIPLVYCACYNIIRMFGFWATKLFNYIGVDMYTISQMFQCEQMRTSNRIRL